MNEPVLPDDGLVRNFATARQRLELWELLRATAEGGASARASLLELLTAMPQPASALTEVAVHHAGGEAARARCEAHLADARPSTLFPLRFQEFSAVFPADTRFHQRIQDAFSESGWAQAHLQALEGPPEAGVRAARALVGELDTLADEAAGLLSRWQAMRDRIKPPLHLLQVQALVRAELALGGLRGRKVLEVGPQEGGLLLELIRVGANATGVDLGPQLESPHIIQGDFLSAELPGPFELIVATAVFEANSCARGEQDSDPRNNSRAVLGRLHELTAPGGIVVLENIMFPIPFTREDAGQAGFDVLRLHLPAVNLRTGGRGCTLRRTL